MTKRTYVGELGQSAQTGLLQTLRAEATHWNVTDVLVQMWTFQDGGFEVRETGNNGIHVLTTYIGSDEEEAFQTFLSGAFGM